MGQKTTRANPSLRLIPTGLHCGHLPAGALSTCVLLHIIRNSGTLPSLHTVYGYIDAFDETPSILSVGMSGVSILALGGDNS